jgi:hypothetical protein
MLKYLQEYESLSDAQVKTFKLILSLNLILLKILLVFAKLA